MSGPIVRKYGFPNFEKIFGEREPQHGIVDAEDSSAAETEPAVAKPAEPASKGKARKKKDQTQ